MRQMCNTFPHLFEMLWKIKEWPYSVTPNSYKIWYICLRYEMKFKQYVILKLELFAFFRYVSIYSCIGGNTDVTLQ